VYALAAMGTCDIVGPQKGAIAAPDDVSAFAAGLTQLLGDSAQLSHMSQEAREFATSWSAPERARQLAMLYRSLTD
jgi:1,2-diacylglycerol 3-alpha-glucosyltransferase